MNRHDSRQWDAQNNINVYRREGSKVRLLRPDLEEIRRDLEKKNERLRKEIKWMQKMIEEALIDVEMVRDGAEDWIEFVEERLKQALEGRWE